MNDQDSPDIEDSPDSQDSPDIEDNPDSPTPADIRRRRLVLVSAVVLAVSLVGTVAVIASRDDDPFAGSRPPQVTPSTPVARITMTPSREAPRSARGLAEVVRRGERYELRLIAQKLPPARDDTAYRVYFAGESGEKTIGRVTTDSKGTLLGEARIDGADLTKFSSLRLDQEAPTGSTLMLRGRLPR